MLNLSIIKTLRMALNIWFPRDIAVKKKRHSMNKNEWMGKEYEYLLGIKTESKSKIIKQTYFSVQWCVELACAGLRELLVSISSQLWVQWPSISRLKCAMVGAFTTQNWHRLQIRALNFFFREPIYQRNTCYFILIKSKITKEICIIDFYAPWTLYWNI